MGQIGVKISTFQSLNQLATAIASYELILIHHHDELYSDDSLAHIRQNFHIPVIAFAHSTNPTRLWGLVDAIITMGVPNVFDAPENMLVIAHPAWVPSSPRRRRTESERSIGTSGFLKFDRQLPEIVLSILPSAQALGWRIKIHASPWRIASPGLLESLRAIERQASANLEVTYAYLRQDELNERLSQCDILWCWTREPSAPYASGVASSLYASGTRVVVADKLQHHHILALPNVVRAPADIDGFVRVLIDEMRASNVPKHDPDPISWRHQAWKIRRFFEERITTS